MIKQKNLVILLVIFVLVVTTSFASKGIEAKFQALDCLRAGTADQDPSLVDIELSAKARHISGDTLELDIFSEAILDSNMDIIAVQFDVLSQVAIKIISVESFNNLGYFWNDHINMQVGQARVGGVTYYPVTTGGMSGQKLFTIRVVTKGTQVSFDPFFINATSVKVNPNPVVIQMFGVSGVIEKTNKTFEFGLSQNYPNPFNPTTTIGYNLEKPTNISIEIYNVKGEKVVSLVDGYKVAGSYKMNFNAEQMSSGIYFYRLVAGEHIATKTMILQK